MNPATKARLADLRARAAVKPCGTRAKYIAAKCRCMLCRAANSRYVGYTKAQLAHWLGAKMPALQVGKKNVTPRMAMRVEKLYLAIEAGKMKRALLALAADSFVIDSKD